MNLAQQKPASPVAPDAAHADLLGEAVSIKPPETTQTPPAKAKDSTVSSPGTTIPRAAEDENQPGFIGQRNVQHP